jgi:hypothetical protein
VGAVGSLLSRAALLNVELMGLAALIHQMLLRMKVAVEQEPWLPCSEIGSDVELM